MISKLQAFLITAAKEQGIKDIKLNTRKFPEPFRIKALSLDEYEKIQKLSTDPENKTERYSNIKMLKRAVTEGCVEPNFKSAEFIEALGVNTTDEAINKTLNAGEVLTLGNAILRFSGFGESVEEARKEARD